MVTANTNIYSNQPKNKLDYNIPNLMRRINALQDNAGIAQTNFNRYDKAMTKTSFGTPDAGVSIPSLTGIDAKTVLVCPDYVTDMRTAIQTLAPYYKNEATGNAYNWTASSADNLYYVAMGDRTDYGATGGAAYDWTRSHATMDGSGDNRSPSYDIDIGEVYEAITSLEASELVAGGYSFGDIIRWANSPAVTAMGIGGDANTIWHCGANYGDIYELSPTDFSSIRNDNSPDAFSKGIGGDIDTIWHSGAFADTTYELSIVDFSTIRSGAAPYDPTGIGGDANTIWESIEDVGLGVHKIYELSTTDLSTVRNANSPSTLPTGIGGDASTIWHADRLADDVYELSTTDFSTVRSANSPSSSPRGIGGDVSTIWHCDSNTDRVYELST